MKNLFSILIIFLLPYWSAVISVQAATRPLAGVIDLQTAMEAALKDNQSLKADSITVDIGKAHLLQTRLPDNPELVVGSENIPLKITGQSETSIKLQQTLHPFTRGSAVNLSKKEIELADAVYQHSRSAIITEVKSAFITVLLTQRMLDLHDSLISLAKTSHGASVQIALAGKVSIIDTFKTSAELYTSVLERESAVAELQTARRYLAKICGSNSSDFIVRGNDLDSLPALPPQRVFLERLYAAPESRVRDCELTISKAALTHEKRRRLPPLTIGGGWGNEGPGKYHAIAEVSLSIPIINRNQGAVKAAEYTVSKVEYDRNNGFAQLAADVDAAYSDAARARLQNEVINKKILPQIIEIYNASFRAYTTGKFTLFEMIDAQRTLFETLKNKLESAAQYRQSIITLERITGIAPSNQ